MLGCPNFVATSRSYRGPVPCGSDPIKSAEVGPCALVQTPFPRPDFGDSNCAEYLNLPLSSPPNCSERSTRVPRIYHAVGGSAERPSNVAMNAAVHLDGFVVNYHDDESAFEYVTQHCGREAGQAYRCLLAPAFRADLFRFCAPVSYTHLTLPTICSV